MNRPSSQLVCAGILLVSALCLLSSAPCPAGELRFERIVVDDDFPAGYQVEVADVNGDGKPDLVALGGSTVAWYENPTWTKRVITGPDRAPDVISSAAADLDGDGKAEVAIAYDFEMNNPRRGKLGLAVQGASPDDPWTFKHIADVPSIHRVRWGEFTGDGALDLVAAPIFGPTSRPPDYNQSVATIQVFRSGRDRTADHWFAEVVGERPVVHAIAVLDFGIDDGGFLEILTADNLGVTLFHVDESFRRSWRSRTLARGAPGGPPRRGASEIHVGRLSDGGRFLTTIEPWHGNQVVVYVGHEPETREFGPRTVIDETLDDGHALWVADVDGDGDDEVFAGHRGKDHRVSVYDFDRDSRYWNRTVIDRDVAAQDLRGGDLDGDGVPDVVAIGGATHNVVWYQPVRDGATAPTVGDH